MRQSQIERAHQLIRDKGWEQGVRIVGIDPGKKAPFTAAVHSAAAEAQLGAAHLPGEDVAKYGIFTMGKVEYYHAMGFTRRIRDMRKWIASDGHIQHFNENVPSAKTASLAKYIERATAVLAAIPHLSGFYVQRRRVRRSRWRTYIHSQRALDTICNTITGGNPDTIVGAQCA